MFSVLSGIKPSMEVIWLTPYVNIYLQNVAIFLTYLVRNHKKFQLNVYIRSNENFSKPPIANLTQWQTTWIGSVQSQTVGVFFPELIVFCLWQVMMMLILALSGHPQNRDQCLCPRAWRTLAHAQVKDALFSLCCPKHYIVPLYGISHFFTIVFRLCFPVSLILSSICSPSPQYRLIWAWYTKINPL